MNNQIAYNTLSSITDYLIFMHDHNTDQELQVREDCLKILREAKNRVGYKDVSVSVAYQYAHKWNEIWNYGRLVQEQMREKIRAAVGYY